MRYISTNTSPFFKLGDIKTVIKTLKEAGFTAYDFSMFCDGEWMSGNQPFLSADDYIEKAKELRAFADGIGIVCNQTHAPFPSGSKGEEYADYNAKMLPLLHRAIEVSGILGAKVCVVHPITDYTAEENATFYRLLEATARKSGVKIGLENMWTREKGAIMASRAACTPHGDFRKHLDLLPADVFVACLDLGHAEMAGLHTSAVEMIETLSDRLEALHVHDTDDLNDKHQIPFTQSIDFEPIIEALKRVNYQGDITMEAGMFAEKAPAELQTAVARYMAAVADYFKNRLEKN